MISYIEKRSDQVWKTYLKDRYIISEVNLGLNLYIVSTICCVVVLSDNKIEKSKR